MALGLPDELWRGGAVRPLRSTRKAMNTMVRLNIPLDPAKTGKEAASLENSLHRMIVGQDEAVEEIVNIYQMHLTGMSAPGRPIGSFLFLGPTGSGKTRIVEAMSEALVKNPRAVVKIDCAEFQHSHEIAKLIGSPPGYLGHRETHPLLSQEVLNQYHTETTKLSFVLFDEIEKASDALWNLLLGILDKATLTLGDNRKVDFSRTLIFMTSNLGASEMSALMSPKLGFMAGAARDRMATGVVEEGMSEKLARSGLEAARRKFTPEFMNRLDKVVTFQPLGTEQLKKVLDIELNLVQQRIFNSSNERAFVFTLSDASKEYVLEQGTDLKYGARHLKRAIERLLVQPMSNLIATEQVRGGDWIRVDYDEGDNLLRFARECEGLPVQEMIRLVDTSATLPLVAAASGASAEPVKIQTAGRRRN
jgi:ATP-dependent Clp protease ATP-binding subunit ClpB